MLRVFRDRKITIILLGILALLFLLVAIIIPNGDNTTEEVSGDNVQVVENTNEDDLEGTPQTIPETNEEINTEPTPSEEDINSEEDTTSENGETTDGGNTTTPIDQNDQETNDNIELEEIFPTNPKPLDLEPHEQSSIEAVDSKSFFSSIVPYYGNGYRIKLISFTEGPTAVFEIGNTSESNLVITNNELEFVMKNQGGQNIAGSYIVEGNVTIAPNQIKVVTVKAKNSKANSINIAINGDFMKAVAYKNEDITDTTPYIAEKDDYTRRAFDIPERLNVEGSGVLTGDGQFKYVADGIQVIDNDRVGNVSKPKTSEGTLALVKVKVANTSDEVMKITKIDEYYGFTETTRISINETTMKSIGSSALPLSIEPNSIVEGYIPVAISSSNDFHMLEIESNMGIFYISEFENFEVLK